ncbi:hypothetical protein [Pararhizobium sp.]|uniref:hypothetical protein n=1 Tax=Pararhizobium sp. TaxID=1977563 RepID=UPI003D1460ED
MIIKTQKDMDLLVDVVHGCMERVIPALIARIEVLEGGGGSQVAQNKAAFKKAQIRAAKLQASNNARIIADIKADMAKAALDKRLHELMAESAVRRAGKPLPVVPY